VTRAPVFAWLLTAAACSGVERAADWHRHTAPPPGAFDAPGPFDAMASDGIWGVGDRVAYTIDVDAAGTQQRFTFTLTTTQLPPSSPDGSFLAHPVHGRVLTRSTYGQWGHPTWNAETRRYEGARYHGWGRARLRAELSADDGTRHSGEFDSDTFAFWYADDVRHGGLAGVHELFVALLGLDAMHATLLRVIRPPSAWSVVRNLGSVRLGLEWPETGPIPVEPQVTPFGELPTVWVPFTIVANGQPALDGRIQFTWKHPPLLLTAGVLQIEAWHPDDPTRRVVVELASAQRGTPADAPHPDELGHGLRCGMTHAEVLAVTNGRSSTVVASGALADGRHVELLEFDVPHMLLFGVMHEGRLLFANPVDTFACHYLALRGLAIAPLADG
jgi:hypothetical protein